ncbi:MAG TPA: TetR family transcriptional regulator [Candidatus Melainabacteria bacterium]|jgi:TetR/AcrR family transcriptional regulator, transcriptional repressor for nem operon|nr:TetR family transcriptional regulator [Candidatus Melainabacteria bacterium]HIN63685.1 TetR family transcriptional regulator [Candidatus Obscuribacterales bacterium]
MNAKVTTRQDTKQLLLEAGAEVMIEKGYTNSGIQEVLSKVGVPKGSFYHYFDSKEDFALAIIEEFDRDFMAFLTPILTNESLTPKERLRSFCESKRECMRAANCRKGCLIGNLSQEMSDQSETLRQALSEVMEKRLDAFAACIKEGQERGEITTAADARTIADLFSSSWEGAMMRAKTIKNLEPLNVFINLMFELVLKK